MIDGDEWLHQQATMVYTLIEYHVWITSEITHEQSKLHSKFGSFLGSGVSDEIDGGGITSLHLFLRKFHKAEKTSNFSLFWSIYYP